MQGLRKTYGKRDTKFDALRGISIDIREGESVAVIGKSGSGKSTLMHLLALLDKPSRGEILLHGRPTAKLKARKLNRIRNKEFGFVFQSFFMNSNDTVLNNVILSLKIAGVGYRERRRRAIAALKTVELDDKRNSKANDLSGGQNQRVCIARAIVNNPKVIFADEPTGNLDSATGEKIEKFARRTNFNNYASVNRLRDILKKLGIRAELTSLGAGPDSIISIAGREFTLVEDW